MLEILQSVSANGISWPGEEIHDSFIHICDHVPKWLGLNFVECMLTIDNPFNNQFSQYLRSDGRFHTASTITFKLCLLRLCCWNVPFLHSSMRVLTYGLWLVPNGFVPAELDSNCSANVFWECPSHHSIRSLVAKPMRDALMLDLMCRLPLNPRYLHFDLMYRWLKRLNKIDWLVLVAEQRVKSFASIFFLNLETWWCRTRLWEWIWTVGVKTKV